MFKGTPYFNYVKNRIKQRAEPEIIATGNNTLVQVPESGHKSWKTIEDELYYHGFINRKYAEEHLHKKNKGSFLVRRVVNENFYVISVKDVDVHHIKINVTKKKKLVWIDTFAFKSITHMIEFYVKSKVPIRIFPKREKESEIPSRTVAPDPIPITVIFLKKCVTKLGFHLTHEQITTGKLLGSGNFGKVQKGLIKMGFFSPRKVAAIKVLTGASESLRDGILQEAELMRELDHENVVKIFGIAASRDPIMIAMEFCAGGSLESKIKKNNTTCEQKLKFLLGASRGLGYLHRKGIIHRDIAARNCLLDARDNIKISDFGLSAVDKSGHGITNFERSNLPIVSMDPMILMNYIYTKETDVYSFGAMIYEIFHKCVVLYSQYERNHAMHLLSAVYHGNIHLYMWKKPENVGWVVDKVRDDNKKIKRIKKGQIGHSDEIEEMIQRKTEDPGGELAQQIEILYERCRDPDREQRLKFNDKEGESIAEILERIIDGECPLQKIKDTTIGV